MKKKKQKENYARKIGGWENDRRYRRKIKPHI